MKIKKSVHKEEKNTSQKKTNYIAPQIDVVVIVTEQSVLSSGSGGGSLPGYDGEDW